MQKSMNCFECLKSRFIYKKQFFVHNLRVWNEFDPHMSLLDLRKRHRHLQNGMVIHFGLWLWDFHRNFYINFFQAPEFLSNHVWSSQNNIFYCSPESGEHFTYLGHDQRMKTYYKNTLGSFFPKSYHLGYAYGESL